MRLWDDLGLSVWSPFFFPLQDLFAKEVLGEGVTLVPSLFRPGYGGNGGGGRFLIFPFGCSKEVSPLPKGNFGPWQLLVRAV